MHQLEIKGEYTPGSFGLEGAITVSGDDDTPIYVKATYKFFDKVTAAQPDAAVAKLSASFATKKYYTTDGDPKLQTIELKVTKDGWTTKYIVNPDQERTWFVIGKSL